MRARAKFAMPIQANIFQPRETQSRYDERDQLCAREEGGGADVARNGKENWAGKGKSKEEREKSNGENEEFKGWREK